MTQTKELAVILTVAECRAVLGAGPEWTGTAVYLLWNIMTGDPVYCGLAPDRQALVQHLAKDDLAANSQAALLVEPDFRRYCLARPKGWMGVSFQVVAIPRAAPELAMQAIAGFGLRLHDGTLFNRTVPAWARMSNHHLDCQTATAG